jgi:hypothetical protein
MILAEAYRKVPVTIDGVEMLMPANQAVFRSLRIAALKGSPIAQRRWMQLVEQAEAEQKQAQLTIYRALEREEKARELRELHAAGLELEDPYAEDIIYHQYSGDGVIRDDRSEDAGGGEAGGFG